MEGIYVRIPLQIVGINGVEVKYYAKLQQNDGILRFAAAFLFLTFYNVLHPDSASYHKEADDHFNNFRKLN